MSINIDNLDFGSNYRKLSPEHLDFLEKNYMEMGAVKIADIWGVTPEYVRSHAKRRGINKQLEWNELQTGYLLENYGKLFAKEIASHLNCSVGSVHAKANRLGLKADISYLLTRRQDGYNRIYSCNEHFFDVPNIINSYWAGFIAADGCISDKNILRLAITERYHLEKFKRVIGYTGNILYKKPVSANCKPQFEMGISSRTICKALAEVWNIIPRKTLILQPPSLMDNNQILSYIVGNIDGDGCIRVYYEGKRLRLTIQLLGTKFLLSWIHDNLKRIILEPLDIKTKTCVRKLKTIYAVTYQGNIAKIILNRLINLDIPKMARKWTINYIRYQHYADQFMYTS